MSVELESTCLVTRESRRLGFRIEPSLELVLTLAAVWGALTTYALCPWKLRLLGRELQKSEISEYLRGPTSAPEKPQFHPIRGTDTLLTNSLAAVATRAVDETPQRILILGDSMIEGLLPRLADYSRENGHSLNAVIWYASRTIDWAQGTRLAEVLNAYRPTFVMVVLGSSELRVREVDKREALVEQMLRAIGARKLVWIGPPNWTRDTGINALIQRCVGKGRFFRSAELSFERKRDGVHPTLTSSKHWMDVAAKWIVESSDVPIKLSTPVTSGAPRPKVKVFAPPS